jgi:hypothetical protein
MANTDKFSVYLADLKFYSKNKYLEFVKARQAKGHMKKCAHLSFNEYCPEYRDEQHTYTPKCDQNSFDIRNKIFYGCPQHCHLYERQWWRKTKDTIIYSFLCIKWEVVKFFKWFSSISVIPQIVVFAIILCGIGYISTPILNKILEILKTIYNCPR